MAVVGINEMHRYNFSLGGWTEWKNAIGSLQKSYLKLAVRTRILRQPL